MGLRRGGRQAKLARSSGVKARPGKASRAARAPPGRILSCTGSSTSWMRGWKRSEVDVECVSSVLALARPMDEATGEFGGDEPGAPDTWNFSIHVAKAWEDAFFSTPISGTRKVALRSAMTLSPDRGGVFDVFLGLVRYGLGGTNLPGNQFVSWIHEADFIRSIEFLVERQDLSGVVNLASPHPQPNRDFLRILRQAWGTRIGLPTTRWMIEVGTFLLHTESELVLKSRQAVPGRLLDAGFEFSYPAWPEAANELVARWRRTQSKE